MGRCVVDSLHASEADVQHVAGLQRPLADGELHAGHAPAPMGFVVAGQADALLAGPPHAQEPGAPVQEENTGLDDKIQPYSGPNKASEHLIHS